MIGKRKLLIDTNAKAGDRTLEIDSYAIDHEDGNIDFGKLIRCTETSELCFPVFNFSLFQVIQASISLMHDVRRPNTAKQLSVVVCTYIQ